MSTLAHMTLIFTQAAAKDITCNLDFESNENLDLADMNAMGNAAVSGWNTILKAHYTGATVLKEVHVYAYNIIPDPTPPPIPGPQFQRQITLGPFVYPSGLNGAQVVACAPPQVSLVITFRTAVASRRARGRIYTPPLADTTIDDAGVISAVNRDNTLTAWNNFIVGIQNSATPLQTFTHAVVSLRANLVNVVTARTMKRRVDTQRRRLSRVLDVN